MLARLHPPAIEIPPHDLEGVFQAVHRVGRQQSPDQRRLSRRDRRRTFPHLNRLKAHTLRRSACRTRFEQLNADPPGLHHAGPGKAFLFGIALDLQAVLTTDGLLRQISPELAVRTLFGDGDTAILPGAGQEVMTSALDLLPQREHIPLPVLHEGQHLWQPGLVELRLDLEPFLGFSIGAVFGPAFTGPQFHCRTALGLTRHGIQGNAGMQKEASVAVVPSDAQFTAAVIADLRLQVDLAGIVDDQQVLGGQNPKAGEN